MQNSKYLFFEIVINPPHLQSFLFNSNFFTALNFQKEFTATFQHLHYVIKQFFKMLKALFNIKIKIFEQK